MDKLKQKKETLLKCLETTYNEYLNDTHIRSWRHCTLCKEYMGFDEFDNNECEHCIFDVFKHQTGGCLGRKCHPIDSDDYYKISKKRVIEYYRRLIARIKKTPIKTFALPYTNDKFDFIKNIDKQVYEQFKN